jgi:hypothetical protein
VELRDFTYSMMNFFQLNIFKDSFLLREDGCQDTHLKERKKEFMLKHTSLAYIPPIDGIHLAYEITFLTVCLNV